MKNVEVKMKFKKKIRSRMKKELKQILESQKKAKISSTFVTVTMPSPEYLIKELQKKTGAKHCSSAPLQSMSTAVSAAESSGSEEGIGLTFDSSVRIREGERDFNKDGNVPIVAHSRLEHENCSKAKEFGCIEVESTDAGSSGVKKLTVAVSSSDDPVSLSDSELADAGEIPAQEKSSAGLPPPPTMRLAAISADLPDRTNSEFDDFSHAKMIKTLERLGTLVSIQSNTETNNNDDECLLNADNMNNADVASIKPESNIKMIETRSPSMEPNVNVNNDDAGALLQDVNPVAHGCNETSFASSSHPSLIDEDKDTGPDSDGINDQSSSEFFTNRISSLSSGLSYPHGNAGVIPGLDFSMSSQCSHVKRENEDNMEDMDKDFAKIEEKGTIPKDNGDASKDTLIFKGEMNTLNGRKESSPSALEAGSNEAKPKEIFCNYCQKTFNYQHFHCEVCDIKCTGLKCLQQHKLGKPHAAKVKFAAAKKRGIRRSVFNDDLRIELDRRRLKESRNKGKVYYLKQYIF